MKKTAGVVVGFGILLGLLVSMPVISVPNLTSYQGKLEASDGTLIHGSVSMVFSIYPTETGTLLLYSEEQLVSVDQGIYSVQVGAGTPLFGSFSPTLFAGDSWLEVEVEGEILTPRQRITAAPYALQSAKADEADYAFNAGDANTLDSMDSSVFATISHLHDSSYVNEGQANAITSAMIVDNSVAQWDLLDGTALAEILDDDGPGSGLNADLLDGLTSGSFALSTHSHSITGANIVDGTVTSADIANETLTASDLAPNSVGESEIRWSIVHSGPDLNGGLMGLINTSDGTSGNFPMGVSGGANGAPGAYRVIGVFGGAPGLGYGSPLGDLPAASKIGVAGASDTGYGVAAVSETGTAIYAHSDGTGQRGLYAEVTGGSADAVYGVASGSSGWAIRGSASGTSGRAVYGYASNNTDTTNYGGYFTASGTYGRGVYGYSAGSSGYGGYFYGSNIGLYSRGYNGFAGVFRGNVQIQDGATGASVMELGTGLDYAEGFDVSGKSRITPGSVLIIDSENPGKLTLSDRPYDNRVAGIVAGANNLGSGVRLGAGQFDHDVALAGRVYCNVDATKFAVKPGDMLTTADIPGYAMKSTDPSRAHGAILGKAMQPLVKGRRDQILVLVSLQ